MEESRHTNLKRAIECNQGVDFTHLPNETHLAARSALIKLHYATQSAHKRRNKNPRGFVYTFFELQKAIGEATQWVWPDVLAQINRIRVFALNLKRDYEQCQLILEELKKEESRQNEKSKQNKLDWAFRPRFVGGGRADGNSP